MNNKYLNFMVTHFALIVALVIVSGCSKKPHKEKSTLELPEISQNGGIWIQSTDFTTGSLSRFDARTGSIQQNLLTTTGDALPVFSPLSRLQNRFILLSRSQKDSIQQLRWDGIGLQIESDRPLENGFNAQSAFEDKSGALWVVGYGSDEILQFKGTDHLPNARISLAHWNESVGVKGETSELNQVWVDESTDEVWVSAQRLERNPLGWSPSGYSGLSVIDKGSLRIVKEFEVPTPNLLKFWIYNGIFYGASAGDLSLSTLESSHKSGRIFQSTLSARPFLNHGQNLREIISLQKMVPLEGKLVDATLCSSSENLEPEKIVYVHWKPEKETSCIEDWEGKSIYCSPGTEGARGYGIAQVVCMGDSLVAVENKGMESEILLFKNLTPAGNTSWKQISTHSWPDGLITSIHWGP